MPASWSPTCGPAGTILTSGRYNLLVLLSASLAFLTLAQSGQQLTFSASVLRATDGGDPPIQRVWIGLGKKKFVVADVYENVSIVAKGEVDDQYPKGTLAAARSWWAGGGNLFAAFKTAKGWTIKRAVQDEGMEGEPLWVGTRNFDKAFKPTDAYAESRITGSYASKTSVITISADGTVTRSKYLSPVTSRAGLKGKSSQLSKTSLRWVDVAKGQYSVAGKNNEPLGSLTFSKTGLTLRDANDKVVVSGLKKL